MYRRRLLPALLTLGALAAPLGAQPLSLRPEIRVSTVPGSQIRNTSIAATADGGFLATWEAGEQPWVRPFGPDGQARSAESLLGPTLPLHTRGPQLARLAGGRSVAVWDVVREENLLLLGDRIAAQILDASGNPVLSGLTLAGGEGAPDAGYPAVDGDSSGGFVLAWQSSGGIFARRFDREGTPLTSAVPVAESGGFPAVASLPDGGFVVVWTRTNYNDFTQTVLLRPFRPDGTPIGGEIRVAGPGESAQVQAEVAADAAGRFVVAWTRPAATYNDRWRVHAQLFAAPGNPAGGRLTLAEAAAGRAVYLGDVAMRPEGRFLLLWGDSELVVDGGPSSTYPAYSSGDVLARVFETNGTPLGPEVPLPGEPDRAELPGEADASAAGWTVSWSRWGGADAGVSAAQLSFPCGGGRALCLNGNRFRAEVTWRVPANGATGAGTPIPLTDDTGAFWFFDPANYELVVKVLDGRGVNGHFWVFYGSLTDVEFDLTVTDTVTGQQRTYHNPAGTLASQADTAAF